MNYEFYYNTGDDSMQRQFHMIIASASISTRISGSTKPMTCTSVAGTRIPQE